ncbi:MAG: ATP-dependent helicase HrpB [Bdellovibrionales bacterium]|nr:ATP-dependent helicase HrpB [Bdellovibrionales bacterium]
MRPAPPLRLPIDARLPEALAFLAKQGCLVLQAEPGAGKTTRLPAALLEAPWRGDREILVLEPRRLAAKLAAHRVAEELGEPPGERVGYQFRFERVGGPRTRLRFLTEGLLTRLMLSAPELKRVAAVVVDEFHERHLPGDVALAALRRLQLGPRPDLKLVVMSATLDVEAVAAYLGGCPSLKVEGRVFPVEVEYQPPPTPSAGQYPPPLERQVRRAAEAALVRDDAGDLLVFLPGMAEIRRCEGELRAVAERTGAWLLPLHGDLTREEQDRAVRPSERQKIILSTNVAETSVTLPGVRTVIDSGLARVASFSWWSGLPALRTRPVSRASAVQRAGRAGRMAPGRCIRLYSQHDFSTRPHFDLPEIRRADLAQTVLELKELGIADAARFPWFEAPAPASLAAAEELLRLLGAVTAAPDGGTVLTPLGRRIARLSLPPRLARLALEGAARGVAEPAAAVAAALSELRAERVDFLEEALSLWNRRAMGFLAERVRDRVLGELRDERDSARAVPAPTRGSPEELHALRRAVLAAFPDRVARLKPPATGSDWMEAVFSAGGSGSLPARSFSEDTRYVVAVDADERQATGTQRPGADRLASGTRVRAACPIHPDWLLDLEPSLLRETTEAEWSAERGRAEEVWRMRYGELVLEETRTVSSDSGAASLALVDALLGPKGPGLSTTEDPGALGALQRRIAFARTQLPPERAAALPPDGPEGARALLGPALQGYGSVSELKGVELGPALWHSLPNALRADLERTAPEHVTLGKGRRVRVNYEPDRPPWVESRLQDFFGMTSGPTVAGGRMPVTLHLLAPNKRAVQVTSDLASFWAQHYATVRKELCRRYPRHSWPEDPVKGPFPPDIGERKRRP